MDASIRPKGILDFLSQQEISSLYLHSGHSQHELASSLRKIFSGIVSGNIKEECVLSIEKNGPFQIIGDNKLMHEMDVLLS